MSTFAWLVFWLWVAGCARIAYGFLVWNSDAFGRWLTSQARLHEAVARYKRGAL